jgi:hypothetical protein
MRTMFVAVAVCCAGAVLAAACGDADSDSDGGSGAPAPGATPTVDRVRVAAPVDELELIIRESAPPQYAVRIVSGLPNGCAEFDGASITSRNGTTIQLAVANTMPADRNAVCTAIYGTHEEIVELGTDFVSGTEYTVRANDKELKFTAQ